MKKISVNEERFWDDSDLELAIRCFERAIINVFQGLEKKDRHNKWRDEQSTEKETYKKTKDNFNKGGSEL